MERIIVYLNSMDMLVSPVTQVLYTGAKLVIKSILLTDCMREYFCENLPMQGVLEEKRKQKMNLRHVSTN